MSSFQQKGYVRRSAYVFVNCSHFQYLSIWKSIIIVYFHLRKRCYNLFPGFPFFGHLELSLNWTELKFSKFVYILEGFGTIWNILKSGGKIWISIWHWSWKWSWKWVKSKIKFEFGLNIKVSEVFIKKIALVPPTTWQWYQGVPFS